MADAVRLTVIKRFTYRGDPNEEWANVYYLTGDAPADAAAWRALFDAVVLKEKTIYKPRVTVARGYGHLSDDPKAENVWMVDLTVAPETPVPGTFPAAGHDGAGDSAVWARWKTSRLSEKGKPIYLRKYFHPGYGMDTIVGDAIHTSQKAALVAYAAAMYDGTSLPSGRKITAGGHEDTIVSHGASSYITTRTLKRRGKRPTSA